MRWPLVAAVVALLLVLPAGAKADIGSLQIRCRANLSQRASVDPLEFYGKKPSPHNHTPAGALAFSSTSTVREMMSAPTSCDPRTDHSLLWIPTPLQPDGKPARILAFDYYLVNHGYRVGKAPPDGLRFIAGDPHCTGKVCPAIYICRQWDGQILSLHTIPTPSDGCDTTGGLGYAMAVYSPGQCWDGKSLGTGMGASSPAANITGANPCHGWVIPRIIMGLDVGADGLGGYLSSDIKAGTTKSSPGSTGHFDYVLGWRRSALAAIIRYCLNASGFKPGQYSCTDVTASSGMSIYQLRPSGRESRCVTGPACGHPKTSSSRAMTRRPPSRRPTSLSAAVAKARPASFGISRLLETIAATVQSISKRGDGTVQMR